MEGTIVYNSAVADGLYKMTARCDADFSKYRAGQFIHVKLPDSSRILRRPFSIYSVDKDDKLISIVYKLVGEGTILLSRLKPGDSVDALLFLGNGYVPSGRRVLLIGGGVGAAPLMGVMEAWPDREYTCVLGFRTKAEVFELNEYQRRSVVHIATEDGSMGESGFVTAVLSKLDMSGFDAAFCCGPTPMLRAIKGLNLPTPTHVSLEERMGCGMGGCAVCVCKTTDGGRKKVCLDGPVFDIREVEL